MTEIDPVVLLRARRHLSIKSHSPGKIKLKFKPAILAELPGLVSKGGKQALADWDVIEDVKVNALGLNLVVTYDAARLEPESWERLIDGSDAEALAVVERLRVLIG